jgi:hypothetical protein
MNRNRPMLEDYAPYHSMPSDRIDQGGCRGMGCPTGA